MKWLRRLLAGAVVGIGMATSLAGAPAAQAAGGTTLYVNDTLANDPTPTFCPATTLTNLQDTLTALGTTRTNVTIILCTGAYPAATNQVVFDGFTNLKIQSKGIAAMF